jgi:WD40 repeat protein
VWQVWDVSSLDALNPRAPLKRAPPAVLQHACFVYCAAFHPSEQHIVVTGCYDHTICIWNHEYPPHLMHKMKVRPLNPEFAAYRYLLTP